MNVKGLNALAGAIRDLEARAIEARNEFMSIDHTDRLEYDAMNRAVVHLRKAAQLVDETPTLRETRR